MFIQTGWFKYIFTTWIAGINTFNWVRNHLNQFKIKFLEQHCLPYHISLTLFIPLWVSTHLAKYSLFKPDRLAGGEWNWDCVLLFDDQTVVALSCWSKFIECSGTACRWIHIQIETPSRQEPVLGLLGCSILSEAVRGCLSETKPKKWWAKWQQAAAERWATTRKDLKRQIDVDVRRDETRRDVARRGKVKMWRWMEWQIDGLQLDTQSVNMNATWAGRAGIHRLASTHTGTHTHNESTHACVEHTHKCQAMKMFAQLAVLRVGAVNKMLAPIPVLLPACPWCVIPC